MTKTMIGGADKFFVPAQVEYLKTDLHSQYVQLFCKKLLRCHWCTNEAEELLQDLIQCLDDNIRLETVTFDCLWVGGLLTVLAVNDEINQRQLSIRSISKSINKLYSKELSRFDFFLAIGELVLIKKITSFTGDFSFDTKFNELVAEKLVFLKPDYFKEYGIIEFAEPKRGLFSGWL